MVALIGIGVFAWTHLHSLPKRSFASDLHKSSQPRTLKQLLALSTIDLEKCDIGLMDLLCAEGLPGSENLDIDACSKKIDDLAAKVKFDTDRHYYRFREHPEQFRNSLGYYQMMMLEQVMVQDLRIEYNPSLVAYLEGGNAPTYGAFNSDSKNVFIHGLLNGSHYGTCASMPVLLMAVAKRLNYPVNLAGAKQHLYVRYEDYNGKHFNIEPTVTEGFLTPSDEDYKTGQFATTDEKIKGYGWLRPYSNQENLSHFLIHRSICLGMAKRYEEAKETLIRASTIAPGSPLMRQHFQVILEHIQNAPLGDKIDDWQKQLAGWNVPSGARDFYFENRKIQVRFFVGMCPDPVASQNAVDDLKSELAEYSRQMTLTNPSAEYLEHGQGLIALANQTGQKLRIPAETLPPPLNHGQIPVEYLNCLQSVDFGNQEAVLMVLWQHYKEVTSNWASQPELLPQHGMEAQANFSISPLTGQ